MPLILVVGGQDRSLAVPFQGIRAISGGGKVFAFRVQEIVGIKCGAGRILEAAVFKRHIGGIIIAGPQDNLAAAAAKKYPNAKLLVAVPPAPAPGPWRFKPNGNAARAVLAYRRYAELAAGLYPDNTLIFTPGDTPDERRMFADGIYESPFALTTKGKSAFAAAVMEALK